MQQAWLERIETKLRRSGLSQDYVTRTCGELRDHAEESLAAGRNVEMLDHCPDVLAASLVNSYRRCGCFRRIPPWLMLISPFIMTLVVPLLYFTAAGIVLESVLNAPFDRVTPLPREQLAVLLCFFYAGKVATPIVSALMLRSIVSRMSRPWRWGMTMFLLLCVASFCTTTTLDIAAPSIELSLNFELAIPEHRSQIGWQLFQCATALGVGTLFVLQCRHEQFDRLSEES